MENKLMNFNYYEIKSNNQRETLINKFIEMFPKVKLGTIVEINKFYNKNKINELNYKKNINDIINEYLENSSC